MMKSLLLTVVSGLLISQIAIANNKFYSKTANEAQLVFKATVSFSSFTSLNSSRVSQRGTKEYRKVQEEARKQIPYLMGYFQSGYFSENTEALGVLGERYDISPRTLKKRGNLYTATYQFSGKVLFERTLFKGSNKANIEILMPKNVSQIYRSTLRNGHNPCTDDHYNSEGDFFYFWDIDKSGCSLTNKSPLLSRSIAKLTKYANTRYTFPNYKKLYAKEMNIAILLGYIDDVNSINVVPKNDVSLDTLDELEYNLQKLGYRLKDKKDKFRYVGNSTQKGINFFRLYEKNVRNALGKYTKVSVKIVLSDTGIYSQDKTFHRYLVDSFENDNVVVYDGHSGLGGNLNLNLLPKINWDPNLYQVMFINGCSSYPYFNGSFFRAKRSGSKNLEILTSGLPTWSDTATSNIMAFLNNFLKGRTRSYQSIITELEGSNGENGTYLTGVNGDEDNTWKPN